MGRAGFGQVKLIASSGGREVPGPCSQRSNCQEKITRPDPARPD